MTAVTEEPLLTPEQIADAEAVFAMAKLSAHGEASAQMLGLWFGSRQPGVSPLRRGVKLGRRLVEAGLVEERDPSPKGGGPVFALTAKGRRVVRGDG